MTWRRAEYEISTDPARVDRDLTWQFLTNDSYWAPGVPRDVFERSVAGSMVFGIYRGQEQVGFARVVSDRATFAWIGDVFVRDEFRGEGLGKWLMACIVEHPELQGLRRWMLATRDAHTLYEKFGFTPLPDPTRFMTKHDPDVYKRSSESGSG
jgi:GNAT superfamily N-acetyltransferase